MVTHPRPSPSPAAPGTSTAPEGGRFVPPRTTGPCSVAASWLPRTRRALVFVALLAFVLGSAAVQTRADDRIALTSLSEAVDARVFPWVAPAIEKLDAELTAAATAIHEADETITLATWAAYGSGFLRHVKRGRDLDCLAVFDLGRLQAADAPERALARVETVMRAFAARIQGERRDPALVPWQVEGIDAEGQLENRALARTLLERAFSLRTGRELSVLLPRADGGGLATVTSAGEVPLPAMTDAAYLSNAVRYREGMPTAIRQVSVMLFFAVEVVHADGARRRWMLTPTLTWLGLPIPFEPLVFFVAFPHAQARDRFAGLLDPSSDLLRTRLRLATDLLRTGRAVYENGSATKALKRMHQALDLMGPVYDRATRDQLEGNLTRWLDAPSARELSDLEKAAGTMQKVAGDPALYTLFVGSGTLDAVATHWSKACTDMARQLPGSKEPLAAIAAELTRLAAEKDVAAPEAWGALSKRAGALATATGPEAAAIEADLARLEQPLLSAGWRFLPVLGAEGDQVHLSQAHLAEAGVGESVLGSMRYGDFTFDVRPSDAAPAFRLPLRVLRASAEERALACLRYRLACVHSCLRERIDRARAR